MLRPNVEASSFESNICHVNVNAFILLFMIERYAWAWAQHEGPGMTQPAVRALAYRDLSVGPQPV